MNSYKDDLTAAVARADAAELDLDRIKMKVKKKLRKKYYVVSIIAAGILTIGLCIRQFIAWVQADTVDFCYISNGYQRSMVCLREHHTSSLIEDKTLMCGGLDEMIITSNKLECFLLGPRGEPVYYLSGVKKPVLEEPVLKEP